MGMKFGDGILPPGEDNNRYMNEEVVTEEKLLDPALEKCLEKDTPVPEKSKI